MSKNKTMSLADLFNRLINQVKRTMKQSSYKNRNVRRGALGYRAVRKPAVRNNTRDVPPKLVKPSLSNYLNSPFYRTKTLDQSKLKKRSGTQQEKNNKERPISMRGNKRTGSYNGKFHDIDYSGKIVTRTSAVHDHYNNDTLSKPAAFFKGNIKQTLGGFESAIGTIGKNIGGYNYLDASREQQKAFSHEMKDRKNVTKEEVKKAWDESHKKGIAVAEEMKKKGDDSMVDHADKLLASGSADLERVKKGKNAVQRTLVDLASSVTQFGIDAGLGAVTGGGILPIMAIRSGGTAASEARQEGASDLEQLLYGGGKGTLDVLTEKTMSLVKPLTTVMKKGALDDYSEGAINKLLKSQIMDKVIKSPEGKNITYHALKAGVAATGEGAEEMVAEALTTPLKNAIYTDGEKIDVKSVLYSGLQGALTSVALGGVGETADYHQGKNLVKNKGYDDKNNVDALIDEGLQSDESTPANKIAKQLKLIVESGKEVVPGQILAQKRANQEAIRQEDFAIECQKYIAERAAERKGLSPVTVDIDNNRTVIGGATAQRLKETTGRVSARLIDAYSKDKGTALDTAASISRIAVGLGDGRDFSVLLPTVGNESARQIYMEETGSVLPYTNEGTRAVLSKSNMMNRLMMRQEETKFQKGQQKQKIVREAETSLGKNGLSAFSNTLQHSKGKSNSSMMQEFKKYYDGGIVNYPVENIYRMSKHGHLPYPARMAAWQAGYRDSESRMQAEDAGKSDRSARYSINYTSENQPVVILDKNILENVPEENWKSTVRDEMKKFSEGIPVHGKLIKVNAKGRKEFTKGNTTEFYRKNNETVYKDKLNSGSNADEIVWASTDYTNENPKHLRKDDFVDFARGKVLLQSGENKYNASVIIGKRSNGELALYDVVDYKPADFVLKSKKDADPQFKENNSYRRSYAASSNNSISDSKLKNNRNELKQKNSGTFKSQVSLRVVPKKTQDCLKNLAKALNVDIQLDPVLKHDANGFYKDGVIHLSAKTDNPVLSVFKHELTHHIQETAPVEYQKLKEFVMQGYYKGDRKAFQAAIDEKVQAYAKQGERLTRDQAIDEIIANSAERFLIDEAEIAKVVRQDRTLGQTILDAIRNMIKSIKRLMQGRTKELDVLKRAEKLWDDALNVSVENNRHAMTNKTKYQAATVTFADEVEKISSYNGSLKDFEHRAIYMGTTPKYLTDMGFPDIPMGMTSKHVYMCSRESGIFKGKNDHYHGLGKEELQQAPNDIEKPALTLIAPGHNDRVIIFTGKIDHNNNPILMVVSYSNKNRFNNIEIVTNFATSVYGKRNKGFYTMIRDAINDGRILQYDKKKSQSLPLSSSGPNGHSTLGNIDFKKNIAKFNGNVKNKLPSQSEIEKAKDVVKKQTLDRLDQTLPDTSMAEAYKKGVEKAIDKEQYKKYSLKDHPDEQALIDYESLTEKPDMKIVLLNKADMRNLTRKNIIDAGRKNAEKYGGKDGLNRIYVRNKDLNSDIIIGAPAIRHGLQRDYESNALVAMNLGEYLENAIKANEIIPRSSEARNGHVLLGYGRTESGVQYPAYFVVQTLTSGKNELIEFESLYSFNGKKIVEAVGSANQGVQSLTPTTISIADLLDIVNETYSDILPKSVADHYRNKRRETKLGKSVKYSLKDHPDEQALIDYVSTGIETKFIDMPPIRDYEKRAKAVRMKSVEELERQVEQLQEETKLTHGKMPDQRDLINQSNNLVRTLLDGKRTNHKLVDLCAKNTGQMLTAIKRGHEEDAIIQAYNTARELVENLDLVDDTMYLEYKSLRDYLRQTPIKVAKQDRPVDYEDFRKLQVGRLKLTSKDGLPVNAIYEELKELYPALFSKDISNPIDQLQEIADVRDRLAPYDVMLFDEDTEQLIKEAASSLLEIAYNGKPKQTFADKQKAFYNSKVKRFKEQQKAAKDEIRKQYQGIVKNTIKRTAKSPNKVYKA